MVTSVISGDGFPDVIDPEPLIRGYRDGIR
jgi:hypothetical protein